MAVESNTKLLWYISPPSITNHGVHSEPEVPTGASEYLGHPLQLDIHEGYFGYQVGTYGGGNGGEVPISIHRVGRYDILKDLCKGGGLVQGCPPLWYYRRTKMKYRRISA